MAEAVCDPSGRNWKTQYPGRNLKQESKGSNKEMYASALCCCGGLHAGWLCTVTDTRFLGRPASQGYRQSAKQW